MGFNVEFNTILSLPASELDVWSLKAGESYRVNKPGERIFPIDIPIDLSDDSYTFVAKIVIRKITIGEGKTVIEFDVVKRFSDTEAKVITENFAKHA